MTRGSKTLVIAAIVGCLLASSGAFAIPIQADPIQAISSDFLASSFVNTGGAYDNGVLSVNDTADIVVEYASGATATYAGGGVLLTTDLFQDISAGGIADGLFLGGSILLTDSSLNTLLSADIGQMEVKELSAQPDTLVGNGAFTVTGGSLAAAFGGAGEVFLLTFNLQPSGITDFTGGGGVGLSDLKLTPIPEPATMLLVGTGALGAFGWMRRRRLVS